MRKLILCTYSFIFFKLSAITQEIGSSEGTTLAYVITNNELFIASDSKVNHTYGESSLTCKISHYQNFVWSKTGFVDHEKGFSAEVIIRQVISDNLGLKFDSSCMIISNKIKSDIIRFLPLFMKDKKDKNLDKNSTILTTFISSFENGVIVFESRRYSAVTLEKGYGINDSVELTHKSPSKGSFLGVNGVNDSAKTVLNFLEKKGWMDKLGLFQPKINDEPDFVIRTLPDFVYYLVHVETQSSPQYVGKPIAVAKFADGQFIWVRNELRCP